MFYKIALVTAGLAFAITLVSTAPAFAKDDYALSAQAKAKKPKKAKRTQAEWDANCHVRYRGHELGHCLGHAKRPRK